MEEEEEVWEDVVGYEGKYKVSNLGRVKALNCQRTGKERILNQTMNYKGYLYVDLYKNKKQKHIRVHKLVAEAFISNDDNLSQINHKDEDKTNNRADNLEWCTPVYNINYGTGNARRKSSMQAKKLNK